MIAHIDEKKLIFYTSEEWAKLQEKRKFQAIKEDNDEKSENLKQFTRPGNLGRSF